MSRSSLAFNIEESKKLETAHREAKREMDQLSRETQSHPRIRQSDVRQSRCMLILLQMSHDSQFFAFFVAD